MKKTRLLNVRKQQEKKWARKMEGINKHHDIEFQSILRNSLTELMWQIHKLKESRE